MAHEVAGHAADHDYLQDLEELVGDPVIPVRGRVTDVLTPANFFACPDKLNEALERGEAAYQERTRELERRGVLVGGRLPLLAPVDVKGTTMDLLPITPWGRIADVIRSDEQVRRALAALEGRDGMPLIQPDCRAASLYHLIYNAITLNPDSVVQPMAISSSFHLNADSDGTLIPFDIEAVLGTRGMRSMEDEAGFTLDDVLVKRALLAFGKLFRRGHVGISFMDAGFEAPVFTRDTSMLNAVFRARQAGLHPVAPENYFVAQQIATPHFDQRFRTWLDAGRVPDSDVLCASWYDGYPSCLNLFFDESGSNDRQIGYRREARVNLDGLEV